MEGNKTAKRYSEAMKIEVVEEQIELIEGGGTVGALGVRGLTGPSGRRAWGAVALEAKKVFSTLSSDL